MSEITPQELDLIREAQQEFMPDAFIIRRRQYIGDDRFETETIAQDVPGRLTAGSGRWVDVADRFQGITPFTLTLYWDQDIKAGDQAVDAQGRVYEVRDVQAPGTLLTARRCLVDLVTD